MKKSHRVNSILRQANTVMQTRATDGVRHRCISNGIVYKHAEWASESGIRGKFTCERRVPIRLWLTLCAKRSLRGRRAQRGLVSVRSSLSRIWRPLVYWAPENFLAISLGQHGCTRPFI